MEGQSPKWVPECQFGTTDKQLTIHRQNDQRGAGGSELHTKQCSDQKQSPPWKARQTGQQRRWELAGHLGTRHADLAGLLVGLQIQHAANHDHTQRTAQSANDQSQCPTQLSRQQRGTQKGTHRTEGSERNSRLRVVGAE
jgi:hypothetical protein